jgi:hypothetical protein
MPIVVERMDQVAQMFSAPRVLTLVSVPWSPWPRQSRQIFDELEKSRDNWLPGLQVSFFDLRPESDEALHGWYDGFCAIHSPQFELHGHGYGPFWWLANGEIVDCLTKPCEYTLEALQQRYRQLNLEPVCPSAKSPNAISKPN